MSIKSKLRDFIYSKYPKARTLWELVSVIIGGPVSPILFRGWGMTTQSRAPWSDAGGRDEVAAGFLKSHNDCHRLVTSGDFKLTQFEKEDVNQVLDSLAWRHYFVYWSAVYAITSTSSATKNFVECGVCDGLTAFFAMNAARNQPTDFKCYLYDAWEGMKKDYLLDTELTNEGEYSYLNVGNTMRNVSMFESHTVFNRGFIPDSFAKSRNPDTLVWMHIDLNSATPTVGALDFFFDRMETGGIILFDDYGWPGHVDTKIQIDQFVRGRRGILQPLPTGQSIFYRS